MTFMRVKELEAQVKDLEEKLKLAEVNFMSMNKYLNDKGLIDDYEKVTMLIIREAQSTVLRRHFKTVDSNKNN